MPMMNPNPSDIVELFSFVEVTLIRYATVAGRFPGVTTSSVKPKAKKANKAEVTSEEPSKEDKTLECSGSGVGSDTPVDQGGTLNPKALEIKGAPAPNKITPPESCTTSATGAPS